MSFQVIKPSGQETPLVVEIPHASVHVDALSLATLGVPARCIGQDADLYVDELYSAAPELGATVLVAGLSRYVCDLNRSEQDVDCEAVIGAKAPRGSFPHGLIWWRSTDGQPVLQAALSESEYDRRLREYYRPYHQTLSRLLEEKQQRFGFALLLAAHSMPSSGRVGHLDTGTKRADVVPGTRGRTTAADVLIDVPDRLARARGWSVAHDQPYRGGFTTAFYGQPSRGVHVVQVELNRQLYMNEQSLARLAKGFERTRQYCTDLVRELSQTTPETPRF